MKRRRASLSSGFFNVDFAIAIAGAVASGFPQQAEKFKQHTYPPSPLLGRPVLKMDPRHPRTSKPYAIVIVSLSVAVKNPLLRKEETTQLGDNKPRGAWRAPSGQLEVWRLGNERPRRN